MNMILLFHIIVAVASLFYTAYVFFYPSQSRLNSSYVLAGLTLVSGVALVVISPAHMTQTCISGVVYIAAMLVGILAIRHKLITSISKLQ